MRTTFDEQLKSLHRQLIVMGSYCEKAIAMSATALLEGDTTLAKDVATLSVQIDEEERNIEQMCLKLLLQQQPVARDLRTISSALKMITDMERIGDQSADIAEIILTAGVVLTEEMTEVHDMAVAVIHMVTESIDAFVKRDMDIAKAVMAYDDVVDRHFDSLKTKLIEELGRPDTNGERLLDLLMIGKYFERIGDHAVNIAEWVEFSITGKREE